MNMIQRAGWTRHESEDALAQLPEDILRVWAQFLHQNDLVRLSLTARYWRYKAIGLIQNAYLEDWPHRAEFYSRLHSLRSIVIPDFAKTRFELHVFPIGENKLRNRIRFLLRKSRKTVQKVFIWNPVPIEALRKLILELPETISVLSLCVYADLSLWHQACAWDNLCFSISERFKSLHSLSFLINQRSSCEPLIRLNEYIQSMKSLTYLSISSRFYGGYYEDAYEDEGIEYWNYFCIDSIKDKTMALQSVGVNIVIQGASPLSATVSNPGFDVDRALQLVSLGANVNAMVENDLPVICYISSLQALEWMLDRVHLNFRIGGFNFLEWLIMNQRSEFCVTALQKIDPTTHEIAPFNTNSLLKIMTLSSGVLVCDDFINAATSDKWRQHFITDIDALSPQGVSLLHYASYSAVTMSSLFVQRLLECGADPMVRNSLGKTALDVLFETTTGSNLVEAEKILLLLDRCPLVKLPIQKALSFVYLNVKVPLVTNFIQQSSVEEVERALIRARSSTQTFLDQPGMPLLIPQLVKKGCLTLNDLERMKALQRLVLSKGRVPESTLKFLLRLGCKMKFNTFRMILKKYSSEEVLELLPFIEMTSDWRRDASSSRVLIDLGYADIELLSRLCYKYVDSPLPASLRFDLLLDTRAGALPALLEECSLEERHLDDNFYQTPKSDRVRMLTEIAEDVFYACQECPSFLSAWKSLISKCDTLLTDSPSQSIIYHMSKVLRTLQEENV